MERGSGRSRGGQRARSGTSWAGREQVKVMMLMVAIGGMMFMLMLVVRVPCDDFILSLSSLVDIMSIRYTQVDEYDRGELMHSAGIRRGFTEEEKNLKEKITLKK